MKDFYFFASLHNSFCHKRTLTICNLSNFKIVKDFSALELIEQLILQSRALTNCNLISKYKGRKLCSELDKIWALLQQVGWWGTTINVGYYAWSDVLVSAIGRFILLQITAVWLLLLWRKWFTNYLLKPTINILDHVHDIGHFGN